MSVAELAEMERPTPVPPPRWQYRDGDQKLHAITEPVYDRNQAFDAVRIRDGVRVRVDRSQLVFDEKAGNPQMGTQINADGEGKR